MEIEIQGESASTILGWVSIACWIIVYSPQILENYTLKSGEGLSVGFVVIWLLGDLLNLLGSMVGRLLPTMIIIAIYYTLCDTILLVQIYYYRWLKRIGFVPLPFMDSVSTTVAEEQTPLLNISQNEKKTSSIRLALGYAAGFMFIIAFGIGAWWFDDGNKHEDHHKPLDESMKWVIQILGWTSAVLYLGARVPQILKNFGTRCHGLSPALFVFSISGNVAYALSICAASMEREYLIKNASWLAGSALTVFLDAFVVCQFVYYRLVDRRASTLVD